MSIAFVKLEATGNDFVVVDEHEGTTPALSEQTRMLMCDRHRGIGADGVLTILRARENTNARYRMHITNPDGSVPEMCGNGLRCVARHLAETGHIAVGVNVVIDTDAGPRTVVVSDDYNAVTIDMGKADFDVPRQFPRRLDRAALSHVDGLLATTVSMGNPHIVVEASHLPSRDEAARLGRVVELDASLAPERTNVEWVVDRDDGGVDVIVWERGAGLTQACGTGACAVVATLVRHGRRPAGTTAVHLPGGMLQITASDLDTPIAMKGPVRRVFSGLFE